MSAVNEGSPLEFQRIGPSSLGSKLPRTNGLPVCSRDTALSSFEMTDPWVQSNSRCPCDKSISHFFQGPLGSINKLHFSVCSTFSSCGSLKNVTTASYCTQVMLVLVKGHLHSSTIFHSISLPIQLNLDLTNPHKTKSLIQHTFSIPLRSVYRRPCIHYLHIKNYFLAATSI